MEKDKILEILKNMPYGMNLYSSAFGKVEFNGIRYFPGGAKLGLIAKEGAIWYKSYGKYREDGEVTLYPSKEMRNWDKFAWKKGDVLVNNEGTFCIFKEFSSYPYTTFIATFVNNIENLITGSIIKVTHDWHKVPSEDAEKYIEYVNANLKKVSRRLNLETLEVEKIKFEDGDILYGEKDAIHTSVIFILKTDKEKIKYYTCLPLESSMKCYYDCTSFIGNKTIRYAEAEEIEKLFNALAKEGKRWNAEKKVIEDIKPTYKKKSDPPEHKFEPFEKVLVRDQKTDKWTPDLYGSKGKVGRYNYMCIGGLCVYCIPYEGNEHLLGTTNDPED